MRQDHVCHRPTEFEKDRLELRVQRHAFWVITAILEDQCGEVDNIPLDWLLQSSMQWALINQGRTSVTVYSYAKDGTLIIRANDLNLQIPLDVLELINVKVVRTDK